MKKFNGENDFLYPRLRYSWDMIHCLWDFIECIGNNKFQLKDERNLNLMAFMRDFHRDSNFNPGGVLKDYIYLEANSFFQYAKDLKKQRNDKNIPGLPDYVGKLKSFRDLIVGHRDHRERVKFPEGWIMEQEKISKIISIKKLINDVDRIYLEILANQRESRNKYKG